MGLTMKDVTRRFLARPGRRLRLDRHDPAWSGDRELRQLEAGALKQQAKATIARNLERLAEAQERLFANDVYSVLVVLQAIDAAGKDGMIKHVMSGLNPQGCQVFSFKRPSDEDLDHNFLWRYSRCLPERGRIGIFNRSYYEETLVVRVHPELLERQRLPPGRRGRRFWHERYQDINAFERHLTRNGTLILKFFLHISKEEQRRRFLERLDNPAKNWKFSTGDVRERAFWDDYMNAYEDMLTATSTPWAPWYVVPADHKFVTRALVARILAERVRELGLKPPRITREQRGAFEEARKLLLSEKDSQRRPVRGERNA